MELIYTAQASGFEPGKRYRNPQHFDRPEPGVKTVVIVGYWPKVAAAYEEAGVDVTVVEASAQKGSGASGRDEAFHAEISGIRQELASIGVIVESFAAQSLERPAGDLGDTASRLFEVLEAVNSGVSSLKRERDGEVEKVVGLEQEKADLLKQNAELLKQIESLKPANADPEVEALKAKLDAANVSYRSNVSKEALQKQVADLDKQ